jgi:excisionase family DNA binding protein
MLEREIEREMRKQQGILSLREAAARLGMSESTLYRRLRAGELKCVQIGSRRYVSELAIEAYIMRSGGQQAVSEQKTEGSADA